MLFLIETYERAGFHRDQTRSIDFTLFSDTTEGCLTSGLPTRLALLGLVALVTLPAGEAPEAAGISPYVPLHDWTYDIIERLVTAGVAGRREAMDRPIPRARMAALLSRAVREGHLRFPLIEGRFPRRDRFSGRGSVVPYCAASIHWIQSTRDRLPNVDTYARFDFSRGANFVLEVSSALSLADRAMVYMSPYLCYPDDGVQGRLRHAYLSLRVLDARVDVGRDVHWFGPGYHGDFVLTDNPPPFDMVRISRHLGPVSGVLILGQVRAETDTGQRPKDVGFAGLRGAWICTDRIVLEAELGATVPGDNVFLGLKPQKDFDEAGGVNQVAEASITYYPMRGVKLYASSSGDDFWNVGWAKRAISWGRKNASMIGIYLVPSWGQGLDLRVEYADLNEETADNWYTHDNPYFHRGWILGHHIGRNEGGRRAKERDLFLKTTLLMSGTTFLALSYDRESSRFVAPVSSDDVVRTVSFEMVRTVMERWSLRFEGTFSTRDTRYHDPETRQRKRRDGRCAFSVAYPIL